MDIHTPIVAVIHVVLGALGLLSFPFETLIGAYSLWALLRKQATLDMV